MGFLNRQTGDFCRWVYGGSWSALVFIYILGYTMSFCSYLLLFYLTFILSNLLLFNLRLQNVYNLSTKFSTLKYRSENRSRKAGCYTCLNLVNNMHRIFSVCLVIGSIARLLIASFFGLNFCDILDPVTEGCTP